MFKVAWQADQIFFGLLFAFAVSVLFNFLDGLLEKIPNGRNNMVSNLFKSILCCFILILLYKISPNWSRTLFK